MLGLIYESAWQLTATKLASIARKTPMHLHPIIFIVSSISPFQLKDQQQNIFQIDSNNLEILFLNFSYLQLNEQVCFQDYSIDIIFEANYNIKNIEFTTKTITLATTSLKRNKPFHAFFSFDSLIPRLVNESAHLFTRLKKNELAQQYVYSQFNPVLLIDDSARFQHIKKQKRDSQNSKIQEIFSSLSEPSMNILRKLQKYIKKNDMMEIFLEKNLSDQQSKRLLRRMVFPDSQEQSTYSKKIYSRQVVTDLLIIHRKG